MIDQVGILAAHGHIEQYLEGVRDGGVYIPDDLAVARHGGLPDARRSGHVRIQVLGCYAVGACAVEFRGCVQLGVLERGRGVLDGYRDGGWGGWCARSPRRGLPWRAGGQRRDEVIALELRALVRTVTAGLSGLRMALQFPECECSDADIVGVRIRAAGTECPSAGERTLISRM